MRCLIRLLINAAALGSASKLLRHRFQGSWLALFGPSASSRGRKTRSRDDSEASVASVIFLTLGLFRPGDQRILLWLTGGSRPPSDSGLRWRLWTSIFGDARVSPPPSARLTC